MEYNVQLSFHKVNNGLSFFQSPMYPPLAIGQEVLSGGYRDGYILTGPSLYESLQSLNNSDIVHFNTVSQVKSTGPGFYEESMMLHSAGAAASGVTCGEDSLDGDGANFSKSAYCEYSGTSTMFMTDSLNYHSVGGISQGDTELPDSLAMDVSSVRNGYGSFAAGSRSLIGIGNTTALGYVHSIYEDVRVGGIFSMDGRMIWSSFTSSL